MTPDSSTGNPDDTTRAAADLPTRDGSPLRPPSRASDLREGQLLGDYHLIRRLGQGGFGEVWEAVSTSTQRRLAVKVLTAARQSSPDMVARFQREGQLAASVNHARCVFVFGADDVEGYPVITMELMRGGTLQDRLASRGPMAVKEAVDTILDVIEGLEAAHKAGILHRDVKPSNCFLDETGRAKIGDFGISKTLESSGDLTLTGAFLGTPSYASPEQARGREVGLQSDIYSVGATLYALLTGSAPFQGSNAGEVLARIVAEPPTPFSQFSGRISMELQRVILRALSKDTDKRFHSYTEFRAALLPFSSLGLTAGSLWRRFIAYEIDSQPFALAGLFVIARFPDMLTSPAISLSAGGLILPVFYFMLLEKRWGRTVGKYLLGLRVTAADGSPMTTRRVLLRTLTFFAITSALLMAAVALLPGWPVFAFTPLLLLTTMRSRNGYAGLHEILSGTRVMMDLRTEDVVALPDQPVHASLPPGADTRRIGPYRVLETVWVRGSEALRLARDELLHRNVWIHEHVTERAQPVTALTEVRPGRLHWLQGARDGPAAWDAYDAPPGVDFFRWVRQRGRLSWGEVRTVLVDVMAELQALSSASPATARFGPRHIWIDSYGHARLLNFPVSVDGSDESFSPGDWRAFMREIVCFGLRGDSEAADNGRAVVPRVPLAESARPVVQRICAGDGTEPLPSLIDELEKTKRRPTRVTRARRVAPLLILFAPVIVLSAFVGIMSVMLPVLLESGMMDLATAQIHLVQLRRLEQASDQAASAPRREAILKVLAYAYRQALSNSTGRQTLARLKPTVRQELASIAEQYPEVSSAEAADARRALDEPVYVWRPSSAGNTGSGSGGIALTNTSGALAFIVVILAVPTIGVAIICQLLLTLILGTSPLLRLCGISVQRADGRRAGRLRSLLRTAIVWFPFVGLIVTLVLILTQLSGLLNPTLPLAQQWIVWLLIVATGMAYVLGIAYAIARPGRGIPDLLAGTYLMPR